MAHTSIYIINVPQPAGHYLQAVVFKDIVFAAGQLPIMAENPKKRVSSIEEQRIQTLKNIKALLKAFGSDMPNIIKATVYISKWIYGMGLIRSLQNFSDRIILPGLLCPPAIFLLAFGTKWMLSL